MKDRERPVRTDILALLVLPFAAIGALFAGLIARPVHRTRSEVAAVIEAFLVQTGGPYDWDAFICGGRISDPKLEAIRARCASLPQEFPPTYAGEYCNPEGVLVMRSFLHQLTGHEA